MSPPKRLTLSSSTYDRSVGFRMTLDNAERKFADAVNNMTDKAVQVSLNTMRRRCAKINEWAKNYGYAIGRENGLHLKNDWHVRYYRSVYEGKTCYYIDWSGYQFIWC